MDNNIQDGVTRDVAAVLLTREPNKFSYSFVRQGGYEGPASWSLFAASIDTTSDPAWSNYNWVNVKRLSSLVIDPSHVTLSIALQGGRSVPITEEPDLSKALEAILKSAHSAKELD